LAGVRTVRSRDAGEQHDPDRGDAQPSETSSSSSSSGGSSFAGRLAAHLPAARAESPLSGQSASDRMRTAAARASAFLVEQIRRRVAKSHARGPSRSSEPAAAVERVTHRDLRGRRRAGVCSGALEQALVRNAHSVGPASSRLSPPGNGSAARVPRAFQARYSSSVTPLQLADVDVVEERFLPRGSTSRPPQQPRRLSRASGRISCGRRSQRASRQAGGPSCSACRSPVGRQGDRNARIAVYPVLRG